MDAVASRRRGTPIHESLIPKTSTETGTVDLPEKEEKFVVVAMRRGAVHIGARQGQLDD